MLGTLTTLLIQSAIIGVIVTPITIFLLLLLFLFSEDFFILRKRKYKVKLREDGVKAIEKIIGRELKEIIHIEINLDTYPSEELSFEEILYYLKNYKENIYVQETISCEKFTIYFLFFLKEDGSIIYYKEDYPNYQFYDLIVDDDYIVYKKNYKNFIKDFMSFIGLKDLYFIWFFFFLLYFFVLIYLNIDNIPIIYDFIF